MCMHGNCMLEIFNFSFTLYRSFASGIYADNYLFENEAKHNLFGSGKLTISLYTPYNRLEMLQSIVCTHVCDC